MRHWHEGFQQGLKWIAPARGRKKRVLIVNVFMDDRRTYLPNPLKVPQTVAPIYLAGAFSKSGCRVRIYNEHHSGSLKDKGLLAWPDMVVLTGLLTGFDRMRHMVAYAKTLNPKVITVAGGPAIRALPEYSRNFFDYACLGDVEEMREVIHDAWGLEYADMEMAPRYDLMPRPQPVSYLETSRNCNFKCGFCSLTGEGKAYRKGSLKNLEDQLLWMGPRRHLCFLDNNFYGDDRDYFLARIDLLKFFHRKHYFKGWSALVTQDFFLMPENLTLARESGCESLFSGVESFSRRELEAFRKRQNTVLPQRTAIHQCLKAGIAFHYGLMFDPSRRTVGELRNEIELFLSAPRITLPSFISLTIPMPGTPYFEDCVRERLLLPKVKLRDLDGFTQTLKPLDTLEEVAELVRDMQSMRGYRGKVARKAWDIWKTNRKSLGSAKVLLALVCAINLCAPHWINSPGRWARTPANRTYVSTTEPLDPVYRPMFTVRSIYEDYFQPTMVTDDGGKLAEHLMLDYQPEGSRREKPLDYREDSKISFFRSQTVSLGTFTERKDQWQRKTGVRFQRKKAKRRKQFLTLKIS